MVIVTFTDFTEIVSAIRNLRLIIALSWNNKNAPKKRMNLMKSKLKLYKRWMKKNTRGRPAIICTEQKWLQNGLDCVTLFFLGRISLWCDNTGDAAKY